MNCLALTITLTALIAASAAQAGTYEEAYKVYYRNDFKGAAALLEPLAAHGDPRSQGLLGHLYDQGAGVPQDHERAASLWRLEMATVWPRALLGYADAEDALAEIYANGWGV
jgi:TPR repeat protein